VSQTSTATVDPASDEAILAAARNYVAAQSAAIRSANSDPFFAVTTADCNCRIGVVTVIGYLRDNGYHEDVSYSFVDPPSVRVRSDKSADVRIHFRSGPYSILRSDGSVVRPGGEDSGDFVVSFRLEGGAWVAFLSRNS